MAETRQPVILSSGMSPLEELDEAVALIEGAGAPVAVLQCASMYPTPPEVIGLNVLAEYRARWGTAVGLSDHSAKIFPGLAAATLGAEVLEVHLTLSPHMFGPDVVASLTVEEIATLVEGIRFIEAMRAHPVDKAAMAAELAPMRRIFMKSVVAARDLPAGTVLADADLAAKKPGTGIPAAELPSLVGRRLVRAVAADALLAPDDLAPGGAEAGA
jgi:N-acetylneuraminate synthase